MDTLHILKQLKSAISPREDYVRSSRTALMALSRQPGRTWFGSLQAYAQSGRALALTGGLVVLVAAGLTFLHVLGPSALASLDSATLQAEAHEIDFQVKLAHLTYDATPSTPKVVAVAKGKTFTVSKSTVSNAPVNTSTTSTVVTTAATTTASTTLPTATTSTSTAQDPEGGSASSSLKVASSSAAITIDDALDTLTK